MNAKLLIAASSSVALVVALLVGCAESKNGGDSTPETFHFEVGGFEVAPGTEFYQCFTVKAPTGGTPTLDVGAVRFAYTPGSTALHHIVIFSGKDSEVEGSAPCELFKESWEVRYAGGTVTDPLEPPAGVAVPVRPVETWIFQMHYLNSGDTTIVDNTTVDIDFTMPGDEFIPAALVIGGSSDISLPPNSVTDVIGQCDGQPGFPDVNIYSFWPHMHQKGTHFKIEFIDNGVTSTLYDADYDFADQSTWSPATPLTVDSGDSIRTTCSFNNTTSDTVVFGESSTQEMCFNFFFYYPRPAIAPGMIPCL